MMYDITLPGSFRQLDYCRLHDVVYQSILTHYDDKRKFIFTKSLDDSKVIVRGDFNEEFLKKFKFIRRTKLYKNNDTVSFYIRLRATISLNGKRIPILDEELDCKLLKKFGEDGGIMLYNYEYARSNIPLPRKNDTIPSVLVWGTGMVINDTAFNDKLLHGFGSPRGFGHGMMVAG